jgi:DNA-binding NarL/FixJ family response regulator
LEILAHIRAGANNKMIARQLNISVNTVKSHIYNTFQKLGARNRVEALIKAKQTGYLV